MRSIALSSLGTPNIVANQMEVATRNDKDRDSRIVTLSPSISSGEARREVDNLILGLSDRVDSKISVQDRRKYQRTDR